MDTKIELYHDNFQNFKRYNIPKAQLVIADIPYNIGVDAYASNPMWYQGGDNKNGGKQVGKIQLLSYGWHLQDCGIYALLQPPSSEGTKGERTGPGYDCVLCL